MNDHKPYHHGNLKEALVQAGLDILTAEGLTGLSLRACAERAGVSHTAPKNHFGNMIGLQSAIATAGYQRLTKYMTSLVSKSASTSEKRRAALTGYVEFASANPALFELMFSQHRVRQDDPELDKHASVSFDILRAGSAGLIWNKSKTTNAEIRSQIMHWSLVHGFAQLLISGKFGKDELQGIDILDIFPDFEYATDQTPNTE